MPSTPRKKIKRPSPRKSKTPIRKRCANCPKFFTPRTSNQRFHDAACKDQFHNNRSGFGKLRDRLPKFIKAEARLMFCEIEARLKELEGSVKLLLVEREEANAKRAAVRGQIKIADTTACV
jgi:hypothetical protein